VKGKGLAVAAQNDVPPETPRETAEEHKAIAVTATKAMHDLRVIQELIGLGKRSLDDMNKVCDELQTALKMSWETGQPLDPGLRIKVKTLYALAAWQRTADEELESSFAELLAHMPELKKELRREAWAGLWRALRLIFRA
jgi:hypothetical protein